MSFRCTAVLLLSAAAAAAGADGTSSAPQPRLLWSGAEVSALGVPTRDGEGLTVVDKATGELALRRFADGAVVRLTSDAGDGQFAYFSAPSRDGSHVAYAWFNSEGFYELRIVERGGRPRTLYRNPEAGFIQPCAFSPDGAEILTLLFRRDNTSQIALISAKDGSIRTLKSLQWIYPKRMDFSPDGRHIVYDNLSERDAHERDVFLLAIDGSREVRLVPGPANDLFPLFSADGKSVLFSSDRGGETGLWAVAFVDGEARGEPRLVRPRMGRFLPLGTTGDGALIYARRSGGAQLFDAALDGSNSRPLFDDGADLDRFFPRYVPDGTAVAYLTRISSENYGQEHRAVVVRGLPDGPEREVPDRMAHVERLAWSPDARRLLLQGSDRRGRAGLFVFDSESRRTAPVSIDHSTDFRGSPGTWLTPDAVVAARGEQLLRIDLDSREETELSASGSNVRLIDADRSGERLALVRSGRSESVWIGGAEGDSLERVLDLPSGQVTDLEWTDDGKSVIVGTLASDGARLFLVSAAGDSIQPIASPKDRLPGLDVRGERLAFAAGREKEEIWILDEAAHPF